VRIILLQGRRLQRSNPHFEFPRDWKEARTLVDFTPLEPSECLGCRLQSLAVFVRDHQRRELASAERSLEANYGGFVFSQASRGVEEARRLALDTRYGLAPRQVRVAGREGRIFELGPEPAAGDSDPRSPAVVAWCDAKLFYLVASDRYPSADLLRVAESVY
jgi:hypothetical protein